MALDILLVSPNYDITLGYAMRTLTKLDVNDFYLEDDNSIYSVKNEKNILRFSSGLSKIIKPIIITNSTNFLKNYRFQRIVASIKNDAIPIYDLKYNVNSLVVFGDETNGLNDDLVEICDQTVSIPIKSHPKINCLTLTDALAVFLYEYNRQQRRKL